jgi:hypothetical protein
MTTALSLALPTRRRGRQSHAAVARYNQDLRAWCDWLLQIRSSLDFTPGVRGWCYIYEQEHGLSKGDFDRAEELISDCRKSGLLPLDFCALDQARQWVGVEDVDDSTLEEEAEEIIESVHHAHLYWTPLNFWDDKDVYLMLLVEKVDLVSLFSSICREFRIPCANAKGWADINQRAEMMQQFKRMEMLGKQCVLLLATDFDPHGLLIATHLRNNCIEMSENPEIRWNPDRLIIDRFALTREFIDEQRLPWIDGLITGSGKDLADSKERHVQEYISQHGKRKVESNALVVRPDAGRQLLRETIAKYLSADAPLRFERELNAMRQGLRAEVERRLARRGKRRR